MSIPTFFSVDIVGKEVLKFEAVVEVLKVVEEKDNLFANFSMGATIQDGGKRKRSDAWLFVCTKAHWCILNILPYVDVITTFSCINLILQIHL